MICLELAARMDYKQRQRCVDPRSGSYIKERRPAYLFALEQSIEFNKYSAMLDEEPPAAASRVQSRPRILTEERRQDP
jgi:hypothetical protein